MKKKYFKIITSRICMIAISIFVAALIVSCGGGSDAKPTSPNPPDELLATIEDVANGTSARWLCHSPSETLSSSNEVILSFVDTGDAIFFRTNFSGTPDTDVPFDIGLQSSTWEWNGTGMDILKRDENELIARVDNIMFQSDTVFEAVLSNTDLMSATVECFSVTSDLKLINASDYPEWDIYIQLENAGTQEENEAVWACIGLSGGFEHVFGFYPVYESIYATFDNGRFTALHRGLRITRNTQNPIISIILENNDSTLTRHEFSNIEFISEDQFSGDLKLAGFHDRPYSTTCNEFGVTP